MKRHYLMTVSIAGILSVAANNSHAETEVWKPKVNPHASEVKAWEPEYNVKSYGQQIVEEIKAARPDVDTVSLHVIPPGRTDSIIVASTIVDRVGFASNHTFDVWPAKENLTFLEPNPTKNQFGFYAPLIDKTDKIIGTLLIKFKMFPGSELPYPKYYQQGIAIRDQLRAKITYNDIFKRTKVWSGNNPSDPSAKIFAQQLAEELKAKYHLVGVVFHCTPPDSKVDVDIASDKLHRIGAQSGPYDVAIGTGRVTIVEIAPSEGVYEIGITILDGSDRPLGGLVLQFPYDATKDAAEFYAKALDIQKELKARLPDQAALYRLVNKA